MLNKQRDKSNSSNYIGLDENFFSVFDLLLLIAKEIKLILITPLVSSILAIFYVTFIATSTYTSNSKIMSSSGGNNLSQAAGIAAQFGINIGNNSSEEKWVYPEIIKSRTLAKTILMRKFDTIEFGPQKTLLYILHKGNIEELTTNLDEAISLAVDNFIKTIDLSEDIKTSIFTIKTNASEAQLAYEVNQAMIEELDNHQKNHNREKTAKTREFIESRIVTTEKELQLVEEKLMNFMIRNRRIENSPSLLLEQQRINREVIVLTGVFTTLKQQYETTKIEEVKDSDYVIIIDPPEIPLKRSSPKKRKLVTSSGILGILFGLFLSFFKHYLSNKNDNEREKMNKAKKLIKANLLSIINKGY